MHASGAQVAILGIVADSAAPANVLGGSIYTYENATLAGGPPTLLAPYSGLLKLEVAHFMFAKVMLTLQVDR